MYAEIPTSSSYACEVTIDHRRAEPFGGPSKLFLSKKLARKNAAMEALNWLEAQGLLTDDAPGGKSRKRRKGNNGHGAGGGALGPAGPAGPAKAV